MKAEIAISRTQSNRRDAYVTIQISQPGERRITITLEVEAFGQALLGLAGQRCEVEIKRIFSSKARRPRDGFDANGCCDECQRTRAQGHHPSCAANPEELA